MKFSIKGLFSKCDQMRSFLRIWSHLRKKSLMENFIFCAVLCIFIGCFITDVWQGSEYDSVMYSPHSGFYFDLLLLENNQSRVNKHLHHDVSYKIIYAGKCD